MPDRRPEKGGLAALAADLGVRFGPPTELNPDREQGIATASAYVFLGRPAVGEWHSAITNPMLAIARDYAGIKAMRSSIHGVSYVSDRDGSRRVRDQVFTRLTNRPDAERFADPLEGVTEAIILRRGAHRTKLWMKVGTPENYDGLSFVDERSVVRVAANLSKLSGSTEVSLLDLRGSPDNIDKFVTDVQPSVEGSTIPYDMALQFGGVAEFGDGFVGKVFRP